jgi:hypothetical protein
MFIIKNINKETQIINNEYDILDTKITNEEVKKLEIYINNIKKISV